ncbi:cation diffusion facilitator family transporter [Tistlia consotensis]|uniref:Cation diffusion facilitator family transporter n=1 Tax=Tistlia consotensis USBA 355 TaxID=560819 RepID=A0A1Y6BU32_9PROT|nr:CDF family Co(II)/Ni(II) efflux transporter DmeF [Tistlia consotensis]SMF27346.1 cation diffusion facilitator family transporter [Tistlia consotensis USBA 355]SNR66187.1 cation diffusion facilitator family transporter [Tistlia consotensis]
MHSQTLERWTHDHTFGQDVPRRGERPTLVVALVTVVTMVVEIAAGWSFGSMALLADGMHMGSHAVALGLSVFTYSYARRHAGDRRFTFGTGKVNALGAYTSAIVLAGFALVMAWESATRFLAPVPIAFDWALLVAVIGLAVNGVSALLLTTRGEDHDHGAGHHHHADGPHEHGHEHHHDRRDQNLRSAYLHVLADALTSVFAIVALLAGKYFGAVWLDPLMGLLGAVLVARWAWFLLKDTSGVLLDRRADERLRDAVRAAIEGVGDNRIADLHVWAIGPGLHAAALCIVTHDPRDPEHYRSLLPSGLGIVHSTIEVHACRHDPAAAAA